VVVKVPANCVSSMLRLLALAPEGGREGAGEARVLDGDIVAPAQRELGGAGPLRACSSFSEA